MSASDDVDTSNDDSCDIISDASIMRSASSSSGHQPPSAKPHLESLKLLSLSGQLEKQRFNEVVASHTSSTLSLSSRTVACSGGPAAASAFTWTMKPMTVQDVPQLGKSNEPAAGCSSDYAFRMDGAVDSGDGDCPLDQMGDNDQDENYTENTDRLVAEVAGGLTPVFDLPATMEQNSCLELFDYQQCDDGGQLARTVGISDFSFGSSLTDDEQMPGDGLNGQYVITAASEQLSPNESEMPPDWCQRFWHWNVETHNRIVSDKNTQQYDEAKSCSDDVDSDVEDCIVDAHNRTMSINNEQIYDEALSCSDDGEDLDSMGNATLAFLDGCCEGSEEGIRGGDRLRPAFRSYGTCSTTSYTAADVGSRQGRVDRQFDHRLGLNTPAAIAAVDGYNAGDRSCDHARPTTRDCAAGSTSYELLFTNRMHSQNGSGVDWSLADESGLTDLDLLTRSVNTGSVNTNATTANRHSDTSATGGRLRLLKEEEEDEAECFVGRTSGKKSATHTCMMPTVVSKRNACQQAASQLLSGSSAAAATAAATETKRNQGRARACDREETDVRWHIRPNFRYNAADGLDSAGCSPKDDEEDYSDEEEADDDDAKDGISSTTLYRSKMSPGVGSFSAAGSGYHSGGAVRLPLTKHVEPSSFGSRLQAAVTSDGSAASYVAGDGSSASNYHGANAGAGRYPRYNRTCDDDEDERTAQHQQATTSRDDQLARMQRRRQARREREMARTSHSDAFPGYRGKNASIDELISYIDSKPPISPAASAAKSDEKPSGSKSGGSARKSKKKKKNGVSGGSGSGGLVRSHPCDTDSNGELDASCMHPISHISGGAKIENSDSYRRVKDSSSLANTSRNQAKYSHKRALKKSQEISGSMVADDYEKGGGDEATSASRAGATASGKLPVSKACLHRLPAKVSCSSSSDSSCGECHQCTAMVTAGGSCSTTVDSVFWHEGSSAQMCSELSRLCRTDASNSTEMTVTMEAARGGVPVVGDDDDDDDVDKNSADEGTGHESELPDNSVETFDKAADNGTVRGVVTNLLQPELSADDGLSYLPTGDQTFVPLESDSELLPGDRTLVSDSPDSLPNITQLAQEDENICGAPRPAADVCSSTLGCYVVDDGGVSYNCRCFSNQAPAATGSNTPSSCISDARESIDCDCRSLADDYSSDFDAAVRPPGMEEDDSSAAAFIVVTVKKKKVPTATLR